MVFPDVKKKISNVFPHSQFRSPVNKSYTKLHHNNTPSLFRDAVVTVSIAEWDLTCNLFDGETALGPVPRLFAANPDEAHAALISDEARAFRDLQRIMAKFLVPENIPPHKAWDFLNNIRYMHSLTSKLVFTTVPLNS